MRRRKAGSRRCNLLSSRERSATSQHQVCTFVHIIRTVSFQWNAAKANANLRKHGVNFADAATALEDESALTVGDASSAEEER